MHVFPDRGILQGRRGRGYVPSSADVVAPGVGLHPRACRSLALAALVVAGCSACRPASAQEAPPTLPLVIVDAAAPTPLPTKARRRVLHEGPRLEESYVASGDGRPVRIERAVAPVILPDRLRPTDAMRAKLREETLESNRAQLYGSLPDVPELLEDDFVLRQRSRAAESLMGSAVEKAFAVAFQGGVRREASVSVRPEFTTVDHGFKVDASPSWSYKVVAPHQGIRVDLPLTPRPLRVHAWKELRGTDRNPQRLGGGISINPFDQSVRCGMSFEF